MDAVSTAAGAPDRAVRFTGRWQEYLGIAVTNLLLTIVTLGIYRFWAKARERRYRWARTQLIGDELEWTGTGGEMFIGFLIAMGVLMGSALIIFGGAALLGDWFMAVGMLAFYVFIFWAVGFAQFRALRYRLSRTYWRGIRGGSDDNGVSYGWSALGRNFLAGLSAGIAMPWALVENWNQRIRAMSFGPYQLDSYLDTEGLMKRWLLIYPAYVLFLVSIFALAPEPDTEPSVGASLSMFLVIIGVALAIGVIMAAFWALFFRKAAASFEMGQLTAGFDVSTIDWLKFYAKLVGLTIVTLGFGALMWGYLRWKFVIDRLHLYGEVNLDTLTQSTTAAPRDAEGFADAFDIGAF
jgi:uncharacterized membrane protein YjgN (DUF898 family)